MRKQICYHCKFLVRIERDKAWRDMTPWQILLPVCCNHPDSPGVVREMHPGYPACRNFRPRIERAEPLQPADPNIRYIPLTRGLYAIVDAADYEWLNKHKWCASGGRGEPYAVRGKKGRLLCMHREIMKTPPGMVVDHINHNRLDNRRSNMRNCTPPQNVRNRRVRAARSGYLNVYPEGEKWVVRMMCEGKYYRLGPFTDKIEAARARDRLALQLFGEFAYLNFPDLAPQTPPRRTTNHPAPKSAPPRRPRSPRKRPHNRSSTRRAPRA